MKVLVALLNYRSAGLVVDCLRSLEGELAQMEGARVVVVDNASGDGSVEKIAGVIEDEGWGEWVSVMSMERNGGFAYGNNGAIRLARDSDDSPEYVMLLNPDTIIEAGAIRELVTFMDGHREVGIAGSQLLEPSGGLVRSAHRFQTPLSELDGGARIGLITRCLKGYVVSPWLGGESHECDWVSGAAMMIRMEVFDDVGLLDEGYFLYFEEEDFCFRAKRKGWSIWIVSESRVIHDEGQVTGISKAKVRRKRYWYESRRRFFVKSYGVTGLIAADLFVGNWADDVVCQKVLVYGRWEWE